MWQSRLPEKGKQEFLENEFTEESQINISSNDKSEKSIEQMLAYFQDEQNKIFFMVEQNSKPIYESEAFTDDGKFNIVQIPTKYLEPNFNIIFYKMKKDKSGFKELSKIQTNYIDFTKNPGEIIYSKITMNFNLKIKNYSTIGEEITFLDYIKKGGIKIGLNIGIDFTNSNKPPDDPNSLHSFVNKKQKNPYERAILSCGKILECYDYDLLFPVYGFGAVVNGETSHCFNINFEDNPEIYLVDKIIDEYHKCLSLILLSGPTYFAPIINKIISNIKEQNDPREYQVLMILTDGIIQDEPDTIDALVEGSYYPLSVIIIGIGNADFQVMKELDGDDKPLISRKGIKRQRDLVQFVPFNKYEGDANRLVYEVLEEIPRQVIEYYTLNLVYPDMIKEEIDCKIEVNNINIFKKKIIKNKKENENNISDSNIPINFNSFNLNNNQVEEKDEYISGKIINYNLFEKMFPKKAKKNVQQIKGKYKYPIENKNINKQKQILTTRKNNEDLNIQDSSRRFSLARSINTAIKYKNNNVFNEKIDI